MAVGFYNNQVCLKVLWYTQFVNLKFEEVNMADIGDKLRSAREAKGLSIADIEKATKIQSRYLEAIEQNDFDKLPGDFYVRAFIRQYAQIVGLDGKELLSDFHQDVPESKPDEYVENSIDNKSEEVRETTSNKKNLWKNYLPRIAVCLGVIIVILVVYFLYARLSSGGQNNSNDNNVAVSSQTSSSKKNPAAKTKKSSVKVAPLGNNQYRVTGLKSNRKLVLKAGSQSTNASISINGVVQWQQNLTANDSHSLDLPADARTVVVTFGNDTGTSVRIAGKKVPYTATGQYRSLTLLLGSASHSSNTNNSQTGSSTTNNSSYNTRSSRQSQNQSSRNQSSTTQSSSQSQSQTSQSQTSQQNNNSTDNNR